MYACTYVLCMDLSFLKLALAQFVVWIVHVRNICHTGIGHVRTFEPTVETHTYVLYKWTIYQIMTSLGGLKFTLAYTRIDSETLSLSQQKLHVLSCGE